MEQVILAAFQLTGSLRSAARGDAAQTQALNTNLEMSAGLITQPLQGTVPSHCLSRRLIAVSG